MPTHGFGTFIGETLSSIVTQAPEDVQIIVVDGGSTDNTESVVRRFQATFPRLVFHRRERNMGLDRDLALAVELAEGTYCWLMSSDDVVKPHAIDRILKEIQLGHDVYLCNRTECDKNLNPIRDRRWVSRTSADHVFSFSSKLHLIEYLDRAQSLGALFSYISSIIVRRTQWLDTNYDEAITGTNYAHVYRIFRILLAKGTLKYIIDPLVLCRGSNDSFLHKGLLNRMFIDINGYGLLANKLFVEEDVRQAFKAVMRRQNAWFLLPGVRSRVRDKEGWKELEAKLLAYGYNRAQLWFIETVGSWKLIVAVARVLRRGTAGLQRMIRRLGRQASLHPRNCLKGA